MSLNNDIDSTILNGIEYSTFSRSMYFGPSIDETILALLSWLPEKFFKMLYLSPSDGISLTSNQRKESPATFPSNPNIGNRHRLSGGTEIHPYGQQYFDSPESGDQDFKPLNLEVWLEKAYLDLAKEVHGDLTRGNSLIQARCFVLNRLAELMDMKLQLESQWNKRKKF